MFSVKQANILYLLLAILFLTIATEVQQRNVNIGLIITEYGLILLPVLVSAFLLKVDIKKVLRLNPIKIGTAIRIIIISFLMVPSVIFVNLFVVSILARFDKVLIPEIPSPTNLSELAFSFFVVAISAGICEEVFFRGLMLHTYENAYNKKFAAIIAAILFGVIHFNIQNLFGPIVIGLVGAYLVHITDSLYSSILLHTANNGFAVISEYIAKDKNSTSQILNEASKLNYKEIVSSLPIFLITALIGWFFIRIIMKKIRHDSFYFPLGDAFILKGKVFYLVDKGKKSASIISKEEAFDGECYNLYAEKKIKWSDLNLLYPSRLQSIWSNHEFKQNIKWVEFIPVYIVILLYVLFLIFFLV